MSAESSAVVPDRSRLSRAPEWLWPVSFAFVASRLMVFGVILLSRLQVPPGPFWRAGGLLSVLTQGEAARYLSVGQNQGWPEFSSHQPVSAFFPVFPLVLKLLSFAVGNTSLPAVLITNLCLFAAGILLYQLLRVEHADARIARMAVIFLMFTPASYFFSCAVPASLALLLAVASVFAAVKGRWVVACLCGLLLALTVSIGFCIMLPLLLEYVRQSRDAAGRQHRWLRREALLLSIFPLLLAAAVYIGHSRFHDPFALLHASGAGKRTVTSLLGMSDYFQGYASFYNWLFAGTILVSAVICIAGFFVKLRSSYLAFAGVLIVVCWWSRDLEAVRTLGFAFPLFTIMALLSARHGWLYETFLTCSMTLLALCTIVAANGFWVT